VLTLVKPLGPYIAHHRPHQIHSQNINTSYTSCVRLPDIRTGTHRHAHQSPTC